MNGCEECPGIAAGAVARTMTTVIVALASVIVLALAGCANPRGIEILGPRPLTAATTG